MTAPAPRPADLKEFLPLLSRAIAGAGSVAEIEQWLLAQPYVHSVVVEDYLLKSYPPQRRFTVEIELQELSGGRQAIDVYTYDDERFVLRDVHPG